MENEQLESTIGAMKQVTQAKSQVKWAVEMGSPGDVLRTVETLRMAQLELAQTRLDVWRRCVKDYQ